MAIENESVQKVTEADLELASAYYPILIEVAKQQQTIFYGDLVDLAKKRYPENETVKNAIPVSTGRRLNVVRMFTSSKNLPDITSLVINQSGGECGDGFTKTFNPIEVRKTVFDFNWSGVRTDFDGYIEATKKVIKPRRKLKKDAATNLMSEYFYLREKSSFPLPKNIREYRDFIIELIMEGFSPEEAFDEAIKLIEQK